ncbi:HAMP domain-containing histidine kinase [Micromonospora sp. 15K316]|uniref:sensor histidine kinase n=1 Tax=Micromonospora sp. 15K316 TaxID=2530376 RepID=UPI0010512CF1|nr:HAMP domain-containing sensor histidine kinase [Micromonospora sp. 15K316]TDC30709.1 HAMP domain-containing histidine kinase [Micromonospora sp. 15K316]
MAIGVFGLSVGLALGGVVLLGVLGFVLQRSVDGEAFRTADAVALLAAEDALPDPLPVAGGQVRVQVVDGQGRVRAASIDADRLVPMVRPERLEPHQRQRLSVSGERAGLAGPVRVVTVPAGTAADPLTVLVAKSMADVRHSTRAVGAILLVSFPLLVAVLAAVAWRVVGATLRPVESLRRGAEEITGRGGPDRLPVPASHDEVHRLAVTLNGMLDRLESARRRQRAFLADAAHELRSPVTNIRTELEVSRRLGERTDWAAVTENLLADTERLGRLVNDLLLLARLDESDADPEGIGGADRSAGGVGPVELGELLATVAARYPSPPVRVQPPEGPLWTVGHPDELHRILTNLVENAVRHARTRVVLAAEPGGEYHLVTVTDDGPGVPLADRDRVFDRFTRLDDARARDAGGAGLGLSIVRELVRRAGGSVGLADADGPGLRVWLRLPVLPADAP